MDPQITILNDTEFLVSTIYHEPFVLTTDDSRLGAQPVRLTTPPFRKAPFFDEMIDDWFAEHDMPYSMLWKQELIPNVSYYLTLNNRIIDTTHRLYIAPL